MKKSPILGAGGGADEGGPSAQLGALHAASTEAEAEDDVLAMLASTEGGAEGDVIRALPPTCLGPASRFATSVRYWSYCATKLTIRLRQTPDFD